MARQTYPIHNISAVEGSGKAHLQCSFSCLWLSTRHERSKRNMVRGLDCGSRGWQISTHRDVVHHQRVIQDVDNEYNRDSGQRAPAQDPIEDIFQEQNGQPRVVKSH